MLDLLLRLERWDKNSSKLQELRSLITLKDQVNTSFHLKRVPLSIVTPNLNCV